MTNNAAIFGQHDQKTLDQLNGVASRAVRAALLPDGHLGYVMPIGGVAAYRSQISVVGVGFDIACGNMAVRTDAHISHIEDSIGELADEVFNSLSFGVGMTNDNAPTNHEVFTHPGWAALQEVGAPMVSMRDKARNQLGTIGGGNHYVDIFTDPQGWVWVGVHFGSRGLGHKIASGFLALSQGQPWGTRVPEQENLLHIHHPIGAAYLEAMDLAGAYAYAGREWVINHVTQILGGNIEESVHNHHNFAWPEEHDGETLVVVRKGATPAFPGQYGFVGGSMGDDAVILKGAEGLEGREAYDQRRTLFSTVHGAGRVMGRMAAKGKWKKGELVTPGAITHAEMNEWIDERGVTVRGGDLDEAPQAYRRLDEVLKDAPGIEVMQTLRPVIVCMAPGDTVDPYKD